MIDRGCWVWDLETLKGAFTASFFNVDTKETKQFVLHKELWQLMELVDFLKQCKYLIGFNSIGFDYPIIHFILNCPSDWRVASNNEIILDIYRQAQRIIEQQNNTIQFDSIREKDWIIPQLDLFKLWHFNNKARTQSLKGLEIAMNYPNVQDMPIHHSTENITLEQIDEILEYNLNDVMATYQFYLKSLDKIELRKDLNKKYNLNCANYPDSKIGESLVLKLYSEATGQNPWDVKKLRTERLKIALNDVLFDGLTFEDVKFDKFVKKLRNTVVTETKGAIEESIIHKGFKYDFGTGGIHGCIKPGVYESNEEYVIIDADVASLYPSIAVINQLYPEHLGQEFCYIYEDILKQRIEAKKAGNMTISDGFKLSLNSVYGKSNDKFSFLYDPLYTLKTTLNGQLMLVMLCDWLTDSIADLTILQVNTDGITIKIHKDALKAYYQICKEWENKTQLQLEYVEYSKMVIRDVNNYLAITTKGKVKYKGAFEIDKELHKDNSFRIIPIALSEFFTEGIPIENTIRSHTNIYDFCGRARFKGQDYGEIHYLQGLEHKIEKQQKNVRYYISNKGATFIKQYAKGSEEVINKGYTITIFNKYIEKSIEDYKINYNFYIVEAQKEINNIINNQLELF